MDRVGGRSPEETGMQVPIGCGNGDFLPDEAAQCRRDGRRFLVPHAGVADERIVGLQFLGVCGKERLQRRRARFLLAFEKDGEADRQCAVNLLVGAAGLEEGQQLSLVVRCAPARDDLAAAFELLDRWFEGVVFPEIERIDRLDVVMAVEKGMRGVWCGAGVVGDDHRVAGGVANGRLEAEFAQFLDQPFGSLAAFRLEGRIGRYRLDSDEIEKPVEALGKRLVGVVEYG